MNARLLCQTFIAGFIFTAWVIPAKAGFYSDGTNDNTRSALYIGANANGNAGYGLWYLDASPGTSQLFTPLMFVGLLAGSDGNLILQGDRSPESAKYTVQRQTFIGGPLGGSGRVSVRSGGVFDAGPINMRGINSEVEVTGRNGIIETRGINRSLIMNPLENGTSTIRITDEGVLKSSGTGDIQIVANENNSSAFVDVIGLGSTMDVQGGLQIGSRRADNEGGLNILKISFGGKVTTGDDISVGSTTRGASALVLQGSSFFPEETSLKTDSHIYIGGDVVDTESGKIVTRGDMLLTDAYVLARELEVSSKASKGLDVNEVSSLEVNGGSQIVSDTVNINDNGVLTGNNGSILSLVTVDGGVIAPGTITNRAGRLNIEGELIVENGGTLKFDVDGFFPGQYDFLNVYDDLTLMDAAIEIAFGEGIDWDVFSGEELVLMEYNFFSDFNQSIDVTFKGLSEAFGAQLLFGSNEMLLSLKDLRRQDPFPVPEPSTLLLSLSALLFFVTRRQAA